MTPGLFRLFLALVVVVHHSFPIRLGAWAVGMFFVLSGYWIARMWRRKYSLLDSPVRTFFVSRWWRLAPVFLTVHMIAVVLVVSGYTVGNLRALDSWVWWVTQPGIAGSTQFVRLLPPAWSLDVEMQFYLIAPLLIAGVSVLCRRDVAWVFAALLAWAILRFSLGASIEEPRLDLYGWIFLIGCACERFDLRPARSTQWVSAAVFGILLTAVLSFATTRELVWRHGGVETYRLPHIAHVGFFIITVLIGLPLAIGTVYRTSGGWDRWLGDLSFPLYMFHWLPRDWYYGHADWTRPVWWNVMLLMINFAASIVGAVALLQVVDRPAQRLRDKWTGRLKGAM